MRRALVLIIAMFTSQVTFASSQSGNIISLRVSSKAIGNPTHFQLDGIWDDKPACADSWWAIDSDTVAGKSLLSILLTAHSTGKAVTVWGTNICDLRGDMETAGQVGM